MAFLRSYHESDELTRNLGQGPEFSILATMKPIILVAITLAGLWFNWRHMKKALAQIADKNKAEASSFKRAMNYPLTVAWYGYLFAFFVGLSTNNLIFK